MAKDCMHMVFHFSRKDEQLPAPEAQPRSAIDILWTLFLWRTSCHLSQECPTSWWQHSFFWSFLAAGLQWQQRMTTGAVGRATNTLTTILNRTWMSGGSSSNRKGRTKELEPKKRNGPSGSRNRWQSRILLVNGSLLRQKHEFTALGPLGFFSATLHMYWNLLEKTCSPSVVCF